MSLLNEVKRLQKIAGILNENQMAAPNIEDLFQKYQAAENEWSASNGTANVDALIQKYFKMTPEEWNDSQERDDLYYSVMDEIEDGMGGEDFFKVMFGGDAADVDYGDEDEEDEDY